MGPGAGSVICGNASGGSGVDFGGRAIVGCVSRVPFSVLQSFSACARWSAGRQKTCQIGMVPDAEPQPGVLQAPGWKY